jgi:hypothetical protein
MQSPSALASLSAMFAPLTASTAIVRTAVIPLLLARSLRLRTSARPAPAALRSRSTSLALVAAVLTRFAA